MKDLWPDQKPVFGLFIECMYTLKASHEKMSDINDIHVK